MMRLSRAKFVDFHVVKFDDCPARSIGRGHQGILEPNPMPPWEWRYGRRTL